MAKKIENFKRRLRDPNCKQSGEVTKFITQNKSRQEYVFPLRKYVNLIKPDPLHSIHNSWQERFTTCLTVGIEYTNSNQVTAAVAILGLPTFFPFVKFLISLKMHEMWRSVQTFLLLVH